jgi:hypothetical protein
MRLSLIILLIFSNLNLFARSPGNFQQLKTQLQKVSQKELMGWVNGLVSAGAPSRMVGLPGHARARDYIVSELKRLDAKNSGILVITNQNPDVEAIKKFYQKDFDQKIEGKFPPHHPDYQKWFRFTQYMKSFAEKRKDIPVENISWERPGINQKKVLVICAHYDTISHDKKTLEVNETQPMPGANFNASGVAVALALVKNLAQIDLNYSVQVVFLDWQGIGFQGSEIYARELKLSGKEVLGVVNLEMLGQDSTFFDKTKKLGNLSVYTRNITDEIQWTKKLLEAGQRITSKVNFELKTQGFENSDNFRFSDQGFKVATFSQNWEDDFNPNFYHTPQDTAETLNHEGLWYAYQYVAGGVLGTLLDLTK